MQQGSRSSRRSFLHKGAAAAAAFGLSDTLAPLSLAAGSANRVVVCIYLVGGNDSNNMIVPLDSPAYDRYATARGPLALAKDTLLEVRSGSARYGFHPNLPGLQDLYNQNALAVLANVGRTFGAGPAPSDLFLHTGMQVRFLQGGYLGIPWVTPPASDTGKQGVLPLKHSVTLASADADSKRNHGVADSIGSANFDNRFPNNMFGQRLSTVFAALQTASFRQQAYVVPLDGFDTHTRQLERQADALQTLNDGLVAFYRAIQGLGMAESVTIYTDTEFNRALAPNPTGGSEHGWGGHQLILGGSTLGGQIYGTFPSMQPGGADDAIGNGTWIPSTSNSQYAATMAAWYGKRELVDVPEYPDWNNPLRPRLNFLAH